MGKTLSTNRSRQLNAGRPESVSAPTREDVGCGCRATWRPNRDPLSLPVRGARWLIRAYQLAISPLLGPRCRFLPTCSDYAAQALERHGLVRGMWLAVRRIARCHPFGGSGLDPVPEKSEPGSSARADD